MNFLLAIFIYSMILFHWGGLLYLITGYDLWYEVLNERAQEIGFPGWGIFLLRADEQPLERFWHGYAA